MQVIEVAGNVMSNGLESTKTSDSKRTKNRSLEVDMRRRAYTLEVKEFPDSLNAGRRQRFLSELQNCLQDDRPYIVLDCSKVGQLDRPAMQLLLCCLEEAIKRNGDVKLAAVSAGAKSTLQLTGVDRLFEIFETNVEAVNSFRRFSVEGAPSRSDLPALTGPLGNAA